MGKIKKILENELIGGTQSTDVYPVTSVKAVYDESNERLDDIIKRKGVVNISTNYNTAHTAEVLTLAQAIAKVPTSDRVLGFSGTFLSSSGWESYQFTGSSISEWTDQTKWKPSVKVLQELGDSTQFPVSQKIVSDTNSRIFNSCFIGKGNTYSYTKIKVIPSHKYSIRLNTVEWDMTGVDLSNIEITRFNVVNGITNANMVVVLVNDIPEDVYNFVIGGSNTNAYIKVGGRAAQGTAVYFSLCDLTLLEQCKWQTIFDCKFSGVARNNLIRLSGADLISNTYSLTVLENTNPSGYLTAEYYDEVTGSYREKIIRPLVGSNIIISGIQSNVLAIYLNRAQDSGSIKIELAPTIQNSLILSKEKGSLNMGGFGKYSLDSVKIEGFIPGQTYSIAVDRENIDISEISDGTTILKISAENKDGEAVNVIASYAKSSSKTLDQEYVYTVTAEATTLAFLSRSSLCKPINFSITNITDSARANNRITELLDKREVKGSYTDISFQNLYIFPAGSFGGNSNLNITLNKITNLSGKLLIIGHDFEDKYYEKELYDSVEVEIINTYPLYIRMKGSTTSGEYDITVTKGIISDLNWTVNSLSTDVSTLKETIENKYNILSLNSDNEYKNLLNSISRTKYYTQDNIVGTKPLVLLHFSDLHNDRKNLLRIVEFYNYYKDSVINDVIHTGDSVYNNYEADWKLWENSNNFLNVIGNHDTAVFNSADNSYNWTGVSETDTYNLYIKPYVSSWKVTQPDNAEEYGKCYYYKDYVENKVRLIVLDSMRYNNDETQKSWFTNILNDIIENHNDYSLIVSQHYPLKSNNCEIIDCNFSSYLAHDKPSSDGVSTDILDKIDSYIENGGKFICHLTGHVHRNVISYSNKTSSKQLCIAIDAATNEQQWYEDCDRSTNTKSQDAFNIIAFDIDSNCIKIVRVGNIWNQQLQRSFAINIKYDENGNSIPSIISEF